MRYFRRGLGWPVVAAALLMAVAVAYAGSQLSTGSYTLAGTSAAGDYRVSMGGLLLEELDEEGNPIMEYAWFAHPQSRYCASTPEGNVYLEFDEPEDDEFIYTDAAGNPTSGTYTSP